MDVTICICTYGDVTWSHRALTTAWPSAQGQARTLVVHDDTLHGARNTAARLAQSEWLIYLDADDRLGPGYVTAMAQADGDLRAPALVEDYGQLVPVDLADRDIEQMNPCCIGTAIRRDMVLDIGWQPWPAWEDWALFLTAHRRGAVIEHVPDALYIAGVRPGSRNRNIANPAQLHADIRKAAR